MTKSKLQTNNKIQNPNRLRVFPPEADPPSAENFRIWNLFGICDLRFGISFCRGQAVMTLVIFTMLASLGGLLGFSYLALREAGSTRILKQSEQSYYLSEAGSEDIAYRIVRGKQYSSPKTISLGGFDAVTTISDVGATKEITGVGDVRSSVRNTKTILESGGGVSFLYGVQVGEDGIFFENNSGIQGSVYSNGSMTGAQGVTVTGDAIVARATASSADQLWDTYNADFAVGKGEAGSIVTVVDSAGDVGRYVSLALGSDNFARISYYEGGSADNLKFARCLDADCATKNITTVDSSGDVGQYSSVALGSDGFARISYYNDTNDDLKFARCLDADCATKNITTVDSSGDVGQYSSVALGSDGFARISYYNDTNDDLKFARCLDADCATKNITTVDATNSVGTRTSIRMGADDFARISYVYNTAFDLKFARCTNVDCTTKVITTVDSATRVEETTSLALGADGFARISYDDDGNDDLKFVRCLDADCVTKNIVTIDAANNVGDTSSLQMGLDGFPKISYFDDSNGDVKFSQCLDADCAGQNIAIPDSSGYLGEWQSLAIAASDGFGRIGYFNDTGDDLKYARCLNALCAALSPQNDVAQSFRVSRSDTLNFVSLKVKKVGSPVNLSVKILNDEGGRPGDSAGDILAQGTIQTSQVSASSYAVIDVGLDQNPVLDPAKMYWIVADASRDDNNYFLWALDSAGAYANGSSRWSSDWTGGSWTNIAGDFNFQVWLGGLPNFIQDVSVGGAAKVNTLRGSTVTGNATAVIIEDAIISGSAVADSMTDCTISGDASYNSISNCDVSGATTTPVAVPAEPSPLAYPISDAQIQAWKDEATAGGTISGGDYNPPDDATTVIGPGIIEGDLILDNKETLVLAGTIWVKQNIDINNSAKIKLAASYGAISGVLLADGWMHIANNGQFSGSGTPGSYLVFITLPECRGGAQTPICTHHNAAIDLHNNATGAIFYAPNGLVNLHNNVTVTEITARGLSLSQNAFVVYEQGIANLRFTAGPSGGYNIGRWKEVE